MYKYPSISQFRNVIHNVKHKARFNGVDADGTVQYNNKPLPTLRFRGTVKLHGTNASFVKDLTTNKFTFQSRERELELTSDNAGFMLYMYNHLGVLDELIQKFLAATTLPIPAKVVVYGEWCSSGIQKGVAISELPKMFVIFGVKFIYSDESHEWVNQEFIADISSPEDRIYNILDFGSWEIDIDFNYPELSQNQIIEWTMAVEEECPAGKYFGVSATGEGIVFSSITPGWRSSDFLFKSKGAKHALKSKVKTLVPIDIETVNNIKEFAEQYACENRFKQGIQYFIENNIELDIKNLGQFIRWVYNDIIKEESDTITVNQLDPKKLGAPIASISRQWFFKNYLS